MMLGDHRNKQIDNPARNYASLRKSDEIRYEKAGRHEEPKHHMNHGQNGDVL